MPRGKIRDWQGKIGTVVSETGVQHLFMAGDLQGLKVEEVTDGLIVEFESVKAGSGWQAKKVRRSVNQSWGGAGHQQSIATAHKPIPPEVLELIPVSTEVRKVAVKVLARDRHPGLQLDKFLSPAQDQEGQRKALEQVADIPPNNPLFEELRARRADLFQGLKCEPWTRTTSTPLTLHLARASALENAGICLHPIHGFVYLPGSGLKGLARAYADQVWKPTQPDQETARSLVEQVFGNERGEKDPAKHRAGAVVFHDAWPEKWPRLVVDIVNNHHKEYYEDTRDTPPGDWQDPVPVYFLAVPAGATFSFALSARRPEDAPLVETARKWLDGALTHRGAGAKTNAGYGCFAQPATPLILPTTTRLAEFSATLTLNTPAYLAGALQRAEDCDLRAATVRGLLRYWWRTLHCGFVDVPTLRKMESALWGSTEKGGAIQVRVERLPGHLRPIESPYKEVNPQNGRTRFSRQFREDHGIEEAPQGQTQGLAYAGYGMDEGNQDNRKRRWVAPAGMSWRVTLLAQERQLEKGPKLSAESIRKQAKAALWWWCYLGGAGSRSRKGFGSFADPPELKDFEGGKWLSLGKEFRADFGLTERPFDSIHAQSPSIWLMRELAKSLNQNPWLEVPTVWTDPWRVLDEIGMAMQVFAQAHPDTSHGKHCDNKRYLGLPRKLHGPLPRPMQWQVNHQPPIDLDCVHGKRHAAPIFYHVAGTPGQRLTIRVAAFPTATLRPEGMFEDIGLEDCTAVHRDLLTELADYLHERKDKR